jgi:hypothetical protein
MAILVLPAAFYMMAILSCIRSPIHALSNNALELIVDSNLYTRMIDTSIHRALVLLIWGLLGYLAWGIRMIPTLWCLESTPQFGQSLV